MAIELTQINATCNSAGGQTNAGTGVYARMAARSVGEKNSSCPPARRAALDVDDLPSKYQGPRGALRFGVR
jgi:hypothetical protein